MVQGGRLHGKKEVYVGQKTNLPYIHIKYQRLIYGFLSDIFEAIFRLRKTFAFINWATNVFPGATNNSSVNCVSCHIVNGR